MDYKSAEGVLPTELIKQIQRYVDGAVVYIPRKETNLKRWGEQNGTRSRLRQRNQAIYQRFLEGETVADLAAHHYLSEKSIRRILREEKRN